MYLAGILKEWPYGLLWNTASNSNNTVNGSFDAPSWSWASATGPITFGEEERLHEEPSNVCDAAIIHSKIKTFRSG